MPVRRKRCPLCLAILEIESIAGAGEVSRVSFEDRHLPDECARSTLQRIVVLQEMHQRDARELETQGQIVDDLGQWIGISSAIIEAGEKWIEQRDRRAEDIGRLRKAFSTGDRDVQHPLWKAEEELAIAIQAALDRVRRGKIA